MEGDWPTEGHKTSEEQKQEMIDGLACIISAHFCHSELFQCTIEN